MDLQYWFIREYQISFPHCEDTGAETEFLEVEDKFFIETYTP
jgi:hypothetical protein